MPNTAVIPDTPDFRPLFWDTDISTINLHNNRKQIIQRILNFGNEKTYQWLFQIYSHEDIIYAVKSDKNIDRRSAVMIANYFEISKEEIECLKNVSNPNYFPY